MPGPDPTTQLDLIAGHFGKRLKYWRRLRGLTQTDFARELGIDGSYVSKLESSHRRPGPDIARQCDKLLGTGGELAELVDLFAAETPVPGVSVPIAAPGPPPLSGRPTGVPPAVRSHATLALTALAESFADIEAAMGGQHIAESVEHQAHSVIGMQVGSTVSADLLRTAACFARLAAGIRADACDDAAALYWNDCGHRWARDGGDRSLAAELGAQQAILHARHGNTSVAVSLGVQAGQLTTETRAAVWGGIAQAHGLAHAGDESGATEMLATVQNLLTDLDSPLMSAPVTYNTAYLWNFHAGDCHLVLAENGHHPAANAEHALVHLRRALTEASVFHTRDLALTRVHLARAFLCANDSGAATHELSEADALAGACVSPRLRAMLEKTRARLPGPLPH